MRRALLALLLSVGCHAQGEITAPPPPLRPEAEAPPETEKKVAKDCEPTDPSEELKPLPFDQRSIPEGINITNGGIADLKLANSHEVDRATKEDKMVQAVTELKTALKADPYNIQATYELAAAYAQIGRKQCSINLLTRLLQMTQHPFKHAEVEAEIDRLLGRHQQLDPDFASLRGDDRFRVLIEKMCAGTNDPNCVYGGQKSGRER